MRLRTLTAIALGLGLATLSMSAMAEQSKPESPAVGQLPGNKGGEGAAGNLAREKNLIDQRDHSETGDAELTKEERLPGNVGGEGHAKPVGAPSETGYQTGAGDPQTTPVEKRLPGNVGGEGSGKTKSFK